MVYGLNEFEILLACVSGGWIRWLSECVGGLNVPVAWLHGEGHEWLWCNVAGACVCVCV